MYTADDLFSVPMIGWLFLRIWAGAPAYVVKHFSSAVVVVVVCGKAGSPWTSSALPSRYRRSFFSPPGEGSGHLLPMQKQTRSVVFFSTRNIHRRCCLDLLQDSRK